MKVGIAFRRRPRIEMLPLIDMVFLLLVFFIYAMLSMAVHRGLPVVLPDSSSAQIERDLILAVSIKADGSIFLDEDEVLLGELAESLKQKAVQQDEAGVLLFADKAIVYQVLFRVLDQIEKAGITRVSLQAESDVWP